ncbi:MAG: D-Ala-D-Ala carboxypeptidase family metallohydrolase [Terriglobales bacterium]
MMTQLSEHFSLEELTFSESALRLGYQNVPNSLTIENLTRLASVLLEPVRALLAVPIHVNSGYRSRPVNFSVGGAPTSAHIFGRAADIVPIGFDLQDSIDKIRATDLPFDQLIFECRAWIHIAIAPAGATPRREALLASGSPGAWHYEPAPKLTGK